MIAKGAPSPGPGGGGAKAPGALAALARSAAPLVGIVAVALVLQLWVMPATGVGGAFYCKLAVDIGINIVLAVSLTMVNGFTGQFSIGHAAFMAVGAYTAAAVTYYGSALAYGDAAFADATVHGGLISTLVVDRHIDATHMAPLVTWGDGLFALSLVAGGLIAAVCGYVVGMPSLRLKGDYLAIVTLGFGEIVRTLIQTQTKDAMFDVDAIKAEHWWKLPQYLGGAVGFTGLPFYTGLFWVFLACGITVLVALRVKRSTYGRAFLSIREDELAAEAMGVNTTRYKVMAFVIAAFFAGIAGGLYAHTIGVQLNAGELGFAKSFDIIIMVVLGGLGSISGSAIAAVILTILPELLRDPPSLWPWGLLVVAIVAGLIVWRAAKKGRALAWLAAACIAWECGTRLARAEGINLATYRMVLYALALILMMILRPKGLMGVGEVWDMFRTRKAPEKMDGPGGAAGGWGVDGEAGRRAVMGEGQSQAGAGGGA